MYDKVCMTLSSRVSALQVWSQHKKTNVEEWSLITHSWKSELEHGSQEQEEQGCALFPSHLGVLTMSPLLQCATS